MKAVKIYKNDGNVVFTDLDETQEGVNTNNVVYVVYGQTTKEEMRKHLDNEDYMICKYHSEGYNTEFLMPMTSILNHSYHGFEKVYFVSLGVSGTDVHRVTYSIDLDSWQEE